MTRSNASIVSRSRGLGIAGFMASWGMLVACCLETSAGISTSGGVSTTGGSQLPPCTDADPFICEPDTATWATTLGPRTIDGTDNNLANPVLGSAPQPLRRTTTVAYGDGVSTPARAGDSSARRISNLACTTPVLASGHEQSIPNARGASDFLWQWGQFLDDDMSFTTLAGKTPEPFNIPIPRGDPYFDPTDTGTKTMAFNRSEYVAGSVPRQQINLDTAFIDASMVYGSDTVREMALRANDGTGRLATTSGNLLPYNTTALVDTNPNNPDQSGLFMCGDIRCNQQVGLTSMHIVFMREHNRLAGLIHTEQPQLSDEQVYQLARTVVWSEVEHITYDTYLPILLGPSAIPAYSGYRSNVDPSVENMFTNLFRLGHSMLNSNLQLLNANLTSVASGPLPLTNAFFNPEFMVLGTGPEPVLRGLAVQPAQEVDLFIVKEVQDFLFGTPPSGGGDLAAYDIQRGRDHGLGSYTQTEKDYGLPVATTFADLTSNTLAQGKLDAAYPSVDQIDPWVGALAEDHAPGAMVGPLLEAVLSDQFIRTRDGDRYWYESSLPPDLLAWVKTQTLAIIIQRNTTIGAELPADVFIASPPQ